jgi:hypothetical protein
MQIHKLVAAAVFIAASGSSVLAQEKVVGAVLLNQILERVR